MNSDELQKIINAAELVNSNLGIFEVLKNIVQVAADLTNAERGTLYLVDKEKSELWSVITMGAELREIRLKIGEGLAGHVALTGETINIEDAQKDDRFNPAVDKATGYITKSMICFPIKNKNKEIVGVLQLLNNRKGAFTKRDESFLIALSIHSAIAINNALMHREQILINEKLNKAYKELNEAKQEAEKFAMLKAHFLAQMSHEVRTPVHIISSSVQLLKLNFTHIQSEDFNELLQMLENGSNRITRTIDEIIEMSKLKSGNYEINIGPILLEKEILQPLKTIYENSAVQKGVKLIYEKASGEDKIWRDKFMTYQIFQEIIDNAVKFTDAGTVTIRQFVNDEGKLAVSVKDTGIGISAEYMEHLFEPFTQEQSGYSRKYEGNGLALALVKKYAELNNLTIRIKSTKNVGTEFVVIFN